MAELADVLVFADIALHMVLDAAAGITGSPQYRPLDGLSDKRAEVYQATGMISVQLGVDLEEALAVAGTPSPSEWRWTMPPANAVSRRLRLEADPDSRPPA